MVQWKGDLDYNQVGDKAKHLDQINSFNVPNFFAVTRKEVEKILPERRKPEEIQNARIDQEVNSKISEAYSNIGVASEIRNASGKAKNLVGNRRETSRVAIRVSTSKTGSYYQLNVGSSGLEKAVKSVLASYFKRHDEVPALIVQKMVEPGHTGAIVTDYGRDYTLVESVKGLGTPLEDGETVPELYLLKNNKVADKRLPEEQLEVSRHPVNGSNRRRKVKRTKSPYKERKLTKAVSKAKEAGVNLKFIYKRGTFYIVDAKPAKQNKDFEDENLDVVKAAGKLSQDKNFTTVDKLSNIETLDSEDIVSRKGGYTSTVSQKARQKGINLGVSPRESFLSSQTSEEHERMQQRDENPFSSSASGSTKTATLEVLPLNKGRDSLRTKPPFQGKYNIVSRRNQENDIPEEDVLTSYSEVFALDSNTAVLDSRLVPREGLEQALEYIEADQKILIAARVDRKVVRTLIMNDFDAVAIENQDISEVAELVELEERKIILDKVREI